jgi:predicted porin
MRYKPVSCSLLMLLTVSVASAGESPYPRLNFNGFGTLGVVHSSEDQADFTNNVRQPNGAGFNRDWAFSVDSRIGVQGTAELTDKLTGVVQVISEQDEDDTYSPDIEWANIKYDLTPDASVRVGRIVLPTFMVSDFRKVGYANPWVRPPVEVYSLVPVTNNDGIDAIYRFHSGSVATTVQTYFGETDFPVPGAGIFEARKSYGLATTVVANNLQLRAGISHSHLTSDTVNSVFDAFRQFGPSGMAIADRFDLDDKQIDVYTVGVDYDPGDWFVRTEWARTSSPSFLGTQRGWYLTGGYRLGAFTPYASVGQSRRSDATSEVVLDIASLPPAVRPAATGLNTQGEFLVRPNEYDTFTLGTRWDFRRDTSLKVQLDHVRLKDGSSGELVNVQPGFEPGTSFNVFSIALEFVF